MRDKLIELIVHADIHDVYECMLCTKEDDACDCCYAEKLVDYLLENSAIIPPYKVGTKVYVITSRTSNNKNLYIYEDVITHYIISDDFNIMCLENHLGIPDYDWDKVFLIKEEAEKALKEKFGNDNN